MSERGVLSRRLGCLESVTSSFVSNADAVTQVTMLLLASLSQAQLGKVNGELIYIWPG